MDVTHEQSVAWRIVDANFNRATEGLRVIEEYVRFGLDDRHLTSLCKQLRHDITDVLLRLPADQLNASRETQGDVGTNVGVPQEYERNDAVSVPTANLKRVEQSLRCLEEYLKVIDPTIAALIEPMRYRAYTLEKATTITSASLERLAKRTLYVLTDGAQSFDEFAERVDALISAGVHIVQLRDKVLNDRQLIERARLLREKTCTTDTWYIMNDRPDLAVLTRADGVHVGQDELSVKDVRKIVGPQMLVGVSTHSIEQAPQAVVDGANYIGVGPTFASKTKDFESFPGLEFIRQVSCEISLPAFAIGGITSDNVEQVLEAGLNRIAVGDAVTSVMDVRSAAGELLSLLSRDTAIHDRV